MSMKFRVRYFRTKAVEKTETNILCSITFSENGTFYDIMWKNMVKADSPQLTIWHGACALHAGQLRLQTQTRDT